MTSKLVELALKMMSSSPKTAMRLSPIQGLSDCKQNVMLNLFQHLKPMRFRTKFGMTTILENNGDTYIDKFPISIEPFQFNFGSEEELSNWKAKYKIPETASAEEAFYLMRDKYGIKTDDIKDIRRILAIRYSITVGGYSTTKSMQISDTISRASAVQLQERGGSHQG